jgi:hypothetical protein
MAIGRIFAEVDAVHFDLRARIRHGPGQVTVGSQLIADKKLRIVFRSSGADPMPVHLVAAERLGRRSACSVVESGSWAPPGRGS